MTFMQADELFQAKYAIRSAYQARGKPILHGAAFALIPTEFYEKDPSKDFMCTIDNGSFLNEINNSCKHMLLHAKEDGAVFVIFKSNCIAGSEIYKKGTMKKPRKLVS